MNRSLHRVKLSLIIKIISILAAMTTIVAAVMLGLLFYNVAQLSIAPGEVRFETSPSKVEIVVPFSISNQGQFPITSLYISSRVYDEYGEILAENTTGPLEIPPGTLRREVSHRLSIDLTKVKEEVLKDLLFKDQKLQVTAQISFSMQPFFKFLLLPEIPLEWGAPLANFSIGTPQLLPYNSTDLKMKVPVYFKNQNKFIDIHIPISIAVLNLTTSEEIGSGFILIKASHVSEFKGTAEVFLKLDKIPLPTIMFNDAQLKFKVVFKGRMDFFEAKLDRQITYNWSAPIKNLSLGELRFQPKNITHSTIIIPLSFEDSSPFLELSGVIKGEVLDDRGIKLGYINPQSITITPGSRFSKELQGSVSNEAVSKKSLTIRLIFSTQFGDFVKEVVVSA
ncbi:MAG: hypothetical protein QXO15_05095 [Nitrososphaerota archaeon]